MILDKFPNVDINAMVDGNTALLNMCQAKSTKMVEYLLKRGADVCILLLFIFS